MKLTKDNNGEFTWNENGEGEDVLFKVYENGNDINSTDSLLAIQHGHQLPPTIPSNIYSLLLPDDFDQPLDSLPDHVKIIFLFNVKTQLSSIPKSVSTIYFCNGFSQQLNNIPDHIKTIYLGGTVHALDANAITNPGSVTVYKMKSHTHNIPIRYYYY